ncbi:MAG: hypothetical protein M3Y57_23865 [Acidobacteriota bacterium]|nr:hypothetical protein [Acidobacteriota bacterium]
MKKRAHSSGNIGQPDVKRGMALNLYRRDCKSGHPEESRTGEFEERKKGHKRCDCPIFCSGTLQKRFRRQSSGSWEWDDAKAIVG